MVPKVKKETPAPPKAEAKALKAKKAVLKGIHIHKKRRSAHHPPSGGWHCGFEDSLNILGRAPPQETSLTTTPSSSSPDFRVGHEDDRRQQYACVHCGWQGQQAPDETGCEEAVWHWHGQGQHPDQAWWGEEIIYSIGSRPWCFGRCQQNRDHLHWVQLANSKSKHFILKKKLVLLLNKTAMKYILNLIISSCCVIVSLLPESILFSLR